MAMYCQKCGAEVPEGSPVCRSCFEPVKREGFLSRLLRALGGWRVSLEKTSSPVGTKVGIKLATTDRIKIRDALTGQLQAYDSLDEVPEEYREKVRQAREAALRGEGGNKIAVTDASGQTHIYNSLDEVPPDIRALIEKARGQDSSS